MKIAVDENLDIPIYRQVAGAITGEIKKGQLEYGYQLPTVRQLADELGIAKGTIKRAYDDLEATGMISKTRGRGTFVSWQEDTIQSRKDKAMAAIDNMLDLMEGMRFSPTEINIFLDLKIRERMQRETLVSVAAVECCPETQSMLVRSLYGLSGAEVFRKDLYETMRNPEGLSASADLVVTSLSHYEQLFPLVGEEKTFTVAMELTPESISALSRLGKGRLGIFAGSEKFAVLAKGAAARYANKTVFVFRKLAGDETDMELFLRNLDIVVAPAGITRVCPKREEELLHEFAKEHPVVEIAYRADEGSMLYLSQRVKDLQLNKRR